MTGGLTGLRDVRGVGSFLLGTIIIFQVFERVFACAGGVWGGLSKGIFYGI